MKILIPLTLCVAAFGQVPPATRGAPTPPTPTELETVKAENAALRKYIADYKAFMQKLMAAQQAATQACIGQAPADVPEPKK